MLEQVLCFNLISFSTESFFLGMPFIKINDGSVQMSARDAMWMGRPNFSSTQRSLLLSGTAPNGNCGAPPVYTQTPHNTDYYIDGQITHGDYPVSFLSTINRSQSPNHYHYASLSGNPIVSNFCGTNQIMVIIFFLFFLLWC